MSTIVTIFNKELEKHHVLVVQLEALSSEVMEIDDAKIFKPTSGVLMPFMSLLQRNRVSYGIHFSSEEIAQKNHVDQVNEGYADD